MIGFALEDRIDIAIGRGTGFPPPLSRRPRLGEGGVARRSLVTDRRERPSALHDAPTLPLASNSDRKHRIRRTVQPEWRLRTIAAARGSGGACVRCVIRHNGT
ncbi:MAG: hypothetical protein AAGE05_09525 [Pseudomonadota bacterium]